MLEKMNELLAETKKEKMPLLSLGNGNLQFFTEGDTGSEGEDKGSTDNTEQGQDKGTSTGETDTSDTGEGKKETKAEKLFKQEDVNAIAAKEAKKATEKLLKQLGVTDVNSAKEGLRKFNDMQEAQKTEAQKAADRAEALEKENGTYKEQVSTLTAQLAALKADVNPEYLDDVVVLANRSVDDDTTMDEAIEKVLKKYPNFKRAQETKETKKPKFSEGEHKADQKKTQVDAWNSAFNWGGN